MRPAPAVPAACTPRSPGRAGPSSTTSRTLPDRSRVSARRRDFRARQRVRVGGEDAGDVERDVAGAHHDDPLGREVDGAGGDVRVAVVPADHGRGREAAGQVLTRDAEAAGAGGADGVDHRVVPCGQLGRGDVAADLGPEPQPQPRVVVEPGERLADLLRRRVVGRDAVADQAAGHRQAVDQGDPGIGVQQQVFHGVHARRAGADDRDVQGREVAREDPGERRRRPAVEVRGDGGLGQDVPPRVVLRVDLLVDLQRPGQVTGREDRVDRAGVRAGAAVDAGVRVDVEHLGAAEVRLVRRRVDAVDRADRHAGRVGATGLGDREGHGVR